jgi:hypothetical protein
MDSVIESYFADNYKDARQKFLQVCADKQIDVQTYTNDVNAADDNELATDVIRIGSMDADKLLVLTSGVHGAELMCGSGCQVGMLQQDQFTSLAADTAVVMIHALNPWGAANLRRNNEDNVDLCRNFVDFGKNPPHNDAYKEIHEALCCAEREGSARDAADKVLANFRQEKGVGGFVGAIMSGQFEFKEGMSFGGAAPTWSHLTLMEILQTHGNRAKNICLVDYHSGLGPYGYGALVCMHDGESLKRARSWFGHWLMAPMENLEQSGGKFHPAIGHSTEGHLRALPEAVITSAVIEYGTYDMADNLHALLDDHWLHFRGDEKSELGQQIKKQMLDTHYPDDPEWRSAVWSRSEQVVRQAIRGLSHD